MDYRNITRSLVFNKALYKLNKRGEYCLKNRDIYVLLSIYYLQGINGCLRWQIYEYLAKFYRTTEMKRLEKVLGGLMEFGLVSVEGKRYRLSLAGSNALGVFERILRNERWDK